MYSGSVHGASPIGLDIEIEATATWSAVATRSGVTGRLICVCTYVTLLAHTGLALVFFSFRKIFLSCKLFVFGIFWNISILGKFF